MHVLVVRQDSLGGEAVEVVVPDADEGKGKRDVVLGSGGLEMLIHLIGAPEELLEVVEADGEADGEADS